MPIKIFLCYAREDELLLNKLKMHLRPSRRQGLIDIWYDREISVGAEWEREIREHLNSAQIILLLVSPAFMDSDYCYSTEMKRAMERHERGEARVIPIILRPTDWEGAPFCNLQVLPTDAKPVTRWLDRDQALVGIVRGIKKAIQEVSRGTIVPEQIQDKKVPGELIILPEASKQIRDIKAIEEPTSETDMPREATSAEGIDDVKLANSGFRPLTRSERRNLWLKEYGRQDFALQMWVRLVEEQDLEVEMMLQMHGLLVFGVMVSTARYAQFYIDLNEELHRQSDPDTADALREYYTALVPSPDQPEIGPEGLPVIFRLVHMRDVTIMSGEHRVKVPYWRGRLTEVNAFVIGATTEE